MSRGRSPEVRKSEGPEEKMKSEVGSPKSEENNNSAPDSYRDDIPKSELNKSEIVNRKSEIETMEVHHHPEVEKKGFKEYLLEGLMIFIAVMMGFFAESLREHIADGEKEKQYVLSMINDLKDDKGKLAAHIKEQQLSRDMLDSLIFILDDPANISRHGNELYYFGRLGPRFPTLLLNMRTYEQLKNSGNFRLISKVEVSNAIMAYYEKIPYLRQIENIYTEEFASYKKVAVNVFEPTIFKRQESADGGVTRSTENPPLQKNAGGFIKELAIDAIYMNGSREQIIANDEALMKSADELLSHLQKAYRLEDE